MEKLILIIAIFCLAPTYLLAQANQISKSVITKNEYKMSSLDFKNRRFEKLNMASGSMPIYSVGKMDIITPEFKNRYMKNIAQSSNKVPLIQKQRRMKSLDFKHRRFIN